MLSAPIQSHLQKQLLSDGQGQGFLLGFQQEQEADPCPSGDSENFLNKNVVTWLSSQITLTRVC